MSEATMPSAPPPDLQATVARLAAMDPTAPATPIELAAAAKAQADKAAGSQPQGEAPKSEEAKKDEGPIIDAEVVDEKK